MKERNKILIWLVVLLVILNVTTIATILYHNYKERQIENDSVIVNSEGKMINGRMMRNELSFDNNQIDRFRAVNHLFRPMAIAIVFKIDSLKANMFQELQKESVDTLKLNDWSIQIGNLHGKLKQETYRFYIQIKSICTPAQVSKLENIFAPLFKNEGLNIPRGQGHPTSGRGRGMGFENKTINNNKILVK